MVTSFKSTKKLFTRFISKTVILLFGLSLFSTPLAAQIRRDISSLSPAARTELVNLMREYITRQIIEDHCNANASGHSMNIHDGNNFLPFHRAYIEGMEDFLLKKGYPQYVPLPSWDPNTTIPTELRVIDPDCSLAVPYCTSSTSCANPTNWNYKKARPRYLMLPVQTGANNDLCDFLPPSINSSSISDVLEGEANNIAGSNYHNSVHSNMGGAMGYFTSPSLPIFWFFHAYVDDIWKEYECGCPNRGRQQDLYMKDNPKIVSETRDAGAEPSIDIDPITTSEDIWVRNQNDGKVNYTNQNAIYSTLNYIYVRVRNRGCASSIGNEKLLVHWAKALTPQTWPSYWNGSITSPAITGDTIVEVTIPVIAAGASTVIEIPWFPPNSADYSSNSNPKLFSLLARIVAATDPMNTPEGSNVETNAKNNNNIVMKNITVETPPNVLPVISLTEPANNAQFVAPASIVIKANASDNDGSIAKVEFYNGATLLGTSTTSPYVYSWNNVQAGDYTISAKAYDNLNGSTTSSTVAIKVKTNVLPSVSIATPVDGTKYIDPATIAITANATDSDGGISKVEFYNGSNLLGQVVTAPYTFTWTNVTVGTYSITAKAYDNLNASATSTVVTVIVNNNASPSVQLVSPANGATAIAPATMELKATATDSDGSIMKVEFFNGAVSLGTVNNSPYNLTLNNLKAGTYKFTAKAFDDLNAISTSTEITVTINTNIRPAVSLTSPSNGSTFIAPAAVNIQAIASDADGSISKVEFYNGANLFATLNTPPYAYNWNNVSAGTYILTAKAYDDLNAVTTSINDTIVVKNNNLPVVQITAPTNGSSAIAPATFTVKATATDNDGSIRKVEFYAGNNLLASDTTSPFGFDWNNIAAGNYSVTAKAYDNLNAVQTSAAIAVTVTNNALPSVQIISPATGTTFISPASFTIKANASDTDGSISKVEFYNGATLLGSTTTSPYTYNWNAVPTGTHTVTAKAYDDLNAVQTSASVTLIVKENTLPAVQITAPADNTNALAPANFAIKATASDSDGSLRKVEFYEGGNLIGTDTTSPYTYDWNNIAAGSYSLTAKAYDDLNAATTSTVIHVTVQNNALPTVQLTAPATGATGVSPASFTITADASDSDGTIAKVEFYEGATLLTTDQTAPYSFDWTNVSSGTYKLTAKAIDNLGSFKVSPEVQVTITGNILPTAEVTSPTNNQSYISPANITITANATDSDGSITKVEFYEGNNLLGTAATSPYSYVWNGVTTGNYTLTVKAYDNSTGITTSLPVKVIVTNNSFPAVSINSTNGDTLLAPGTTTLEATAFDSDGSISKVEFYNGGTLLSTDNTAPYNYAWNNIAAGVYPVFAKVYDNLNATAFSDTIRIEVISNIAPAVSITAPLNNAIVFTPATVLLKAAASDADGSISKVEFYEGSNLLGSTGTAPYTFEWKNIAVGTYSVTAKATDNYNVSTTSTNIAITVKNNSLPTVNIANPVNGAEAIAPAAFVIKATASDTDGSISKVEFYEGGNLLGTSVSGPYTYNWNNVAKGNYTLTAKAYDDQNDVTTSASVLVNVKENSLPTVVITSPSSGASAIAPATFTISANANDADGSIRKVAFYNGASLIETDSTSPYSINWQNIAAGTYTLTAKAYDDLNAINTSAAVTVTVKDNSLPAVTITSPSNGSTAIAPASFVIKAAASDSDGNITKVEFYSGTTLLSTVTTNPYTYSWNNVTAGDYKITAKAFDNLNAFAVSSEVSVTVTNNTAPAVAIISPVSGTTAIAPASFTLKATASDSDGSIKKVEFYEGVSLLGADSISPYTYDLTALPIGVYTYTAKATDELGATTISTEVKISVHANSLPSVVISAPTDGAIAIAPALIQLKANASDSDGNISKVEFYEGSTLLGTATVSPYSYDWNAVAGSYTLTAKAYDDLNAVAVSPEVKITVKENSLPIVNIVSPATNTTYLAPATIAIKANASDTDGSISKVEFYNGNSLLGEDLTSPYSFDWAGVAVGEYIVTAKAYDNSNAVTTSDNIKVIVVNNFLPTVHITLPVKDTAYIVGTPVSINAVAADANGTINKVEFYANNNLIGTVNSAPFNFSWTNVVSGDYKVIAKAYDDQNAAAISDTVKIKVHENIKPMVMIIRPYDSDQFKIGDTILIVTHHHDDDGTVVKMEFYQNNILLGTDNTAPFDFEWTNVPKGAYSLTAKAYDNLGATEISMPVRVSVSENVLPIAQIVNPISTDVFAANSDIPIIAEAEDPFGRVEWVDFYHDGTKIASDSTSPFFITWKNVPAGSYRLVAEAHDDEGATTYSDDVLINVVNNQGPTVAITSPADSATFITGIDILIQAIASDDGSIKRVEFYRGKVLIATDSVTPYVAIWKNAGQGVYALTAKAYDNTGISTISQPITVKVGNNLTPIVMLMTPVNNAVYTSPAAIDMEAHAHDDDGVIDRVEFYNGTTLLGTDITEPYTYKWTNVGDGSYDLSVKAFDNLGAYSISNIATVTVEGNKLPVIAITSPTNGAVYNAPATLTIEAIAYDPNGTVTKVEFYRGNALLGEDLTSPYAFTWKDIDQGEYTITAKAYDNLNAVTTATAIKIVVNGPTTVPSDADNFKDITLFPMPFDSKVNLRFTTKEPGNAVLKIYNELGKEVCSAEIAFDQGEQNIEVNTEHLPNGIYFFTIQTNEHLLKKKILKLNLN